MGADADDVRSSMQLVGSSTTVFAENLKGCQPPFPFLEEKWVFPGSPHSSAVPVCWAGAQHPRQSPGWEQLWVRKWRVILTSCQAHSPTQSLLTENTHVNQRGQICVGFFYNLPV